ncbi:hypothetical protein [Gordonia sp. C13]|uniref:hypothetical protein n=1 Tax=Gordonia sp. C13 TaxID=2935078 RepID=UPI00200AC82F|nr:hypothetical protein [Gordonia sp. C13]MCK8615500.1 hypothetical protein [Gordonia sp. C13]
MTDLTSHVCVWCSSTEDIAELRGEPRCGRCRTAEQTIAAAREFVGLYGLRPLGGSLASEDEEEHEHRVAAREARVLLNQTRSQTPTRSKSKPEQRVATRTATTAPKASSKTPAPKTQNDKSGVTRPDRAELMSRAKNLLAQLAEIEERLTIAQKDSGLSGKAKVSDLTAKRDSILRTLAALEKANRALEPA